MTVQLSKMGNEGKRTKLFITVGLLLSVLIFLIDLQTPLGIADGVSYVAIVLLTIWIPQRRYVYFAAIIGIGLTLAGFFLSPAGEKMSIVIPNRILAIVGITAATIIILGYKRNQELAVKTKEQLEALFLHANEGIIIIDASGKIVLANPKSAILFNYSTDELSGKSIVELIPEFAETNNKSGTNTGKSLSFEENKKNLVGEKRNEIQFPVEVSASNYNTVDGVFTVAFVMDISRRKKQEAELQKIHFDLEQSAEELRRSNAELENFAYISSHDLQEPLRKIQSFGYRLKEMESSKLGEQSSDYLNRMLNASSRMQNLINDLLLFSRVTSRPQPFTRIKLQDILNDVLSDMEVSVEESHATIESSLGGLAIDGEPTQLRQLFQNLLTNALKFRKENIQPVIKIYAKSISLPVQNSKEYLTIYVEDNGIGFDEKYSDRIFNIFQRLEGNKYPGSGIGLTICRKIVQRHGGNITVKSEVGKGATFMITLPVVQNEPISEEFITKINNYEKQNDKIN